MPKKEVSCPVEITLEVIFGRWKVLIIISFFEDTKRFKPTTTRICGASPPDTE